MSYCLDLKKLMLLSDRLTAFLLDAPKRNIFAPKLQILLFQEEMLHREKATLEICNCAGHEIYNFKHHL